MQMGNVLNKNYHIFVAYTLIKKLEKKRQEETEKRLAIVCNFTTTEKYARHENAHNRNIAHEIS